MQTHRWRTAAKAMGVATVILWAGLLASCSPWPWSRGEPMETGYVVHTYASQVTGKSRRFAMFVPRDYNRNRRDWPLIVFLHGMGERGDDIDLTLKHGVIKEALLGSDFPFLVVAPQVPAPQPGADAKSMTWRELEPDVLRIIEMVEKQYRVDPSRIYLTGLSMGGFGSFSIAAHHPDLFAAVAPICGGGDASLAGRYAGTPFWVFHGLKDTVVPPSRSIEMVEAMRALGQEVKFTTYPDADHDSWTQTYQNDALYAWFLSHQKSPDE